MVVAGVIKIQHLTVNEEYERWKNGENIVENEDYYKEDCEPDEKYISFEKYIEDYEWDVHKYKTTSGKK